MSVTKIPSATSKAVSTLVVTQAMELLDRSGVVERLEQWSPKRRVILNSRAMLAIWLVLAMESRPLTRREAIHLLQNRMSPEAAAALGVSTSVRMSAADATRRSTERLMAALVGQGTGLGEATSGERQFVLANALLRQQDKRVSEAGENRRTDVVVDNIFVPRPSGHTYLPSNLRGRVSPRGWEYNVVMRRNDLGPFTVLGINQHSPNESPSHAAVRLVQDLHRHGFRLGTVVTNPAFTQAPLHQHLREHGSDVITNVGTQPHLSTETRAAHDRAYRDAMCGVESYVADLRGHGSPGRPARGATADALAVTLTIVATNHRQIQNWNDTNTTPITQAATRPDLT